MQRSSQQEYDYVVKSTGRLRLGQMGLDLRQPTEPGALTKLINARFLDQSTIERRSGYSGVRVRDAGGYPLVLDDDDNPTSVPMTPDGWLYGHGQRLVLTPLTRENEHLPIPGQAKGVFSYGGANVVWTGDRLLVVREDGYAALGQSAHWGIDNDPTPIRRGVPAYIPVVTDSTPIDTVEGSEVSTCLTDSMRFTVANGANVVRAWVTHRDTGALVNQSELGGDSNPCDLRVFQSGAFVVCTWRDGVSRELYHTAWTGSQWTPAVTIGDSCDAYDVALVPGGFHVLWRDTNALHVGYFSGTKTQAAPYAFGSTLAQTVVPNGPVALDVSPNGDLAVVFEAADGLYARWYTLSLVPGLLQQLSTLTAWDAGLTTRFRLLSRSVGQQNKVPIFDVFAGRNGSIGYPAVYYWGNNGSGAVGSAIRYNSQVASKAFRVGDRVFCWLRATNSSTLYLVAAGNTLVVSGVADREEAGERDLSDTVRAISQVVQDPRAEHTFTFARPFVTGQDYARAGNARLGDINFLPTFSTAQYGKSVYIAGSLVRNWDGKELGDAGFHDYPVISTYIGDTTGGFLSAGKTYQYRVYPVRYNGQGERIQGAALTYAASTSGVAGTDPDTRMLQLSIRTLPLTNHDDVVFEVYRTEGGQTTFYLDGIVANSLSTGVVTFTSTMSDADLRLRPADPHEVGVAGQDELEEFGPLGCEFLTVAADRLWGAGGQVPRGRVQFSKLKETVEGAGFDALAGWQEIDCEGGEITSIAGFADSALVVFERTKIYVLFGGGPDNYGNGAFSTPQLTLADGAVTHLGTCVTQDGVLYWGVDGPRLLTAAFKVVNLSDPVRPLTKKLTPTGVQADLVRREVVWYTAEGNAVLLNYAGQAPRWAQWTGLKIAACSPTALVTTDGVLLKEDEDAIGDNGAPFEFAGATGELDTEQLLIGRTLLYEVGVVGQYLGDHRLRLKIFYNGSPMWTDQQVWHPKENTWLQSVADVANLTPAQVDALNCKDQSGKYATHKKTSRHECLSFRVEWSDISAFRPTYRLHQLVFELGARGGLGRLPANTFTRS